MMITSTKNPKVQRIRRLQKKGKERQVKGVFVLEGVRLVDEAIASHWNIETLFYSGDLKDKGKDIVEDCKDKDIQVELVSKHVMRAVSDTQTPQGILAVVKMQTLPVPDQLDFVLILDQIREPGNLGAILRSAAAAGVQQVCLSGGTVDPFSPKVLRAGMGAQFNLPVRIDTWEEIKAILDGSNLHTYLAHMDKGEVYYQCDFFQPIAIIIGGEAEGASDTAHQVADALVQIPMPGGGESLNAAVSAGILIFEVVKQRGQRQ